MEQKIALLTHLQVDFFSIFNEREEIYFIGDINENFTAYNTMCDEEYAEYFQLCVEGDDQTKQIPLSLEEWKAENEKSFLEYCYAELSEIDDEVEQQNSNSDYYEYESKTYLICTNDKRKKYYDDKCKSDVMELFVYSETQKGSWLREFCENHEDELVEYYQRGTSESETLSSGGNYGYIQIKEVYYNVYPQ